MSRRRPKIIIVGAGLGGCLAAHRLAAFAEVTFIEQGPSDGIQLQDHGVPVGISPYAGSGLGGATRFWANGLIEPSRRAFEQWPFEAGVLDPWLDEAHSLLGGAALEGVRADSEQLVEFADRVGISPSTLGEPLFYPVRAQNVWESLGLARRVSTVRGYVDELGLDADGTVASVGARTVEGRVTLSADIVILAAGGLGTPGLLQLLPGQSEGALAGQAGAHYDDHPSAFVAEFSGPADLIRLWNHEGPATGGNVRLPLVIDASGSSCAFYVRPADPYWTAERYGRYRAAKDHALDHPWNPASYARLVARSRDALGVAADRAGLIKHPNRFNLFMVAGVRPSEASRVWRDDPVGPVNRLWVIDPDQIEEVRRATSAVLDNLGNIIDDVEIYAGWDQRLESAAHHSGTARLSKVSAEGVCDLDCRVFDVPNLYVGDGSLIPWSGYANTGLTIGALALRLAHHLKETIS